MRPSWHSTGPLTADNWQPPDHRAAPGTDQDGFTLSVRAQFNSSQLSSVLNAACFVFIFDFLFVLNGLFILVLRSLSHLSTCHAVICSIAVHYRSQSIYSQWRCYIDTNVSVSVQLKPELNQSQFESTIELLSLSLSVSLTLYLSLSFVQLSFSEFWTSLTFGTIFIVSIFSCF